MFSFNESLIFEQLKSFPLLQQLTFNAFTYVEKSCNVPLVPQVGGSVNSSPYDNYGQPSEPQYVTIAIALGLTIGFILVILIILGVIFQRRCKTPGKLFTKFIQQTQAFCNLTENEVQIDLQL